MRVGISTSHVAFALALLGSAGTPEAGAQARLVPAPHAVALPGLPTDRPLRVTQLSADGARALVLATTSDEPAYTLLVDTGTGARLWDSRDPAGPQVAATDTLLTDDGLTLVYGVPTPGNPASRDIRRWRIGTQQDTLVFTGIGHLTLQSISSDGTTIAVNDGAELMPLMVITPSRVVRFGDPCPPPTGPGMLVGGAALTGDGQGIVYARLAAQAIPYPPPLTTVIEGRTADGVARCVTDATSLWFGFPPASVSRNGRWLAVWPPVALGVATLLDRETNARLPLLPGLIVALPRGLSADGRVVLLAGTNQEQRSTGVFVWDRISGLTTVVAEPTEHFANAVAEPVLSQDGRTAVFSSIDTATATRTTTVFVVRLDGDGDGMHDAWETAFGLNPADPSDGRLDPDGDGVATAQEYDTGTHPRGTPVRYFAEGANGAFFATRLALFNPTGTAVMANVRFLGPDGAARAMPLFVPALGPAYLDADQVSLPFTEFSTVVESPAPLVAERRMTWDRAKGYGSHNGSGVAVPATTWHFAEGATIAGMQTFFLLQNPGDAAATATMRYLVASGAMEIRTHVVPARSRLTVWANREGTPLDAAEFATTVLGDVPLVVERAMYRDAPGEPFAAGSVASGVVTASTSWFFAEGATGPFFDTYLLLANPGDTAATVAVDFLRAHDIRDISTAYPVARRYVLPPHSRRTVWVAQEDPVLGDTQVGARVTADVPVIAERTMWWPGPTSATWRENHVEVGSTTSGRLWAAADLQVDDLPGGWDTFLLVATTEQYLARIRVAVSCADGTSVTRDKSLSVNRTTLWMRYEFPEVVGRRCAATVESLPSRITSSPTVPLYRVPLVVETATYLGSDFRAGGVTLATRLPDPPQ